MKTLDNITQEERDALVNIAVTTPFTLGTVLWCYNLVGSIEKTENICNYAARRGISVGTVIDSLSELEK